MRRERFAWQLPTRCPTLQPGRQTLAINMAAYYDKPQPLGEVLRGLIDRLGLRKKIDEARVIEAWAEIAGPTINGVTDKAWVKSGTLYVRINSAAWRHELHLRRQAWRTRLNHHLDEELVREIVFC